jgi:branched-chain amino acid aminotransferase
VASLKAQIKAKEEGYSQVLWLDGVEKKYVEEVGAMNIFFKIKGQVVTPALSGSILPGITRRSAIELCQMWGYEVSERRIAADELFAAAKDGSLEEIWGTGTAAVVSPVGQLRKGDEVATIAGGGIGELTRRLYETLTGIQTGKIDGPDGWVTCVS